jgi:hypothetical protein
MKIEKNIVAPFCVFFITVGIGNIIIQITDAFIKTEKEISIFYHDIFWFAGSILGFLYTTIYLKEFLKKSIIEKVLYFTLSLIFVAIAGIRTMHYLL